jgi:hypothetical protein
MAEFGGEGLEEIHDRLAQQSDRHHANATKLLEEIERARLEAEEAGRNFVALSADQLLKTLQSEHSPVFAFLSIDAETPSPGSVMLTAGVLNPDPVAHDGVYVHAFVGGPANLVADLGQALALADPRFQRHTAPAYPGLVLSTPQGWGTVRFIIKVPPDTEHGNYLVNCVLYRTKSFWADTVFARANFMFEVLLPPGDIPWAYT